jgi:hypothetical protein
MPYFFLWSSFVFRDLNDVSRLTNGCVEKFNSLRKHLIPQPILPHKYAIKTYDNTNGKCIEFINWNEKNTKKQDDTEQNIDPTESEDKRFAQECWNVPGKSLLKPKNRWKIYK